MSSTTHTIVTVNTLIDGQIKTIQPLFDERTEYIFWGALVNSVPGDGINLVHELSGIPTSTLKEYQNQFNLLTSNSQN